MRKWLVAYGFVVSFVQAQELILRRVQTTQKVVTEESSGPEARKLYLRGRVIAGDSREPLVGAYVRIPGSVVGAVTDANGEFRIPTTLTVPVLVEVSFVGYETQRVSLLPGEERVAPTEIVLKEEEIVGQEAVISASRIEEQFMKSPVQVVQLSSLAIRSSPSVLSAQTLSFLPGIDVVHSSFTFPVVNARGFNFTQNPRFINRVDGVEMQSTALNVPVLTFAAPPDVDIANVEVIAGPASALYGPNAFNGAMLTTLKDPFQYPGLSAQVRVGANHIADPARAIAPLFDVQARYAQVWRNRIGMKLAIQGLSGEDWWANDTTDRGVYAGAVPPYTTPGSQNPGYLPMNGYGYDARILVSGIPFASGGLMPPFYLSRTGYIETELVPTITRVGKVTGGVYYRLTDQLQAQLTFHVTTGRTVFQGNTRYALQNFILSAYKAEINHPRGFFRVYTLRENGGTSMPLALLGVNLLNVVKPHRDWFIHYLMTYGGVFGYEHDGGG